MAFDHQRALAGSVLQKERWQETFRFLRRDVILGVWRVSRYIRASMMLQKSYQFSRGSGCPTRVRWQPEPLWPRPAVLVASGRGSIWCKLTHFVGGNQSRETGRGGNGELCRRALIALTGSVKSAFQKGCSPVMSPPE